MAGSTDNAHAWAFADVYVGDLTATDPTDVSTAWGTGWDAVGLLDGEEGFTESRDQESSDHYAWGGVLVRTIKSQHRRTFRFVCLEDNDTVFSLVNPGSPAPTVDGVTQLTTKTVKVPTQIKRKFGLELKEGTTVKRRVFTGELDSVDEITEAEGELVAYAVTVVVYPDSSGVLYTELSGTV